MSGEKNTLKENVSHKEIISDVPGFQEPLIADDEHLRLDDLDALELLDSSRETSYDRFTGLCRDVFGVSITLISLVDSERQWFKAACGLSAPQTPRIVSFCGHAIHEHGLMIVPDAQADPRFAGNPLVVGDPYIRFYAGAVLHGPSGYPIGTLCLADPTPRDFSESESSILLQISKLLQEHLNTRFELLSMHRKVGS